MPYKNTVALVARICFCLALLLCSTGLAAQKEDPARWLDDRQHALNRPGAPFSEPSSLPAAVPRALPAKSRTTVRPAWPAPLSTACTDTALRVKFQDEDWHLSNNYITRTRDGNILIPGYTMNQQLPYNHEAHLVKCTPDGDTLWTRRLAGGYGNYSHTPYLVHELEDGSLLAIGSYYLKRPVSYREDLSVTKLTAGGEVLWERTFASRHWKDTTSGFFEIFDIQSTADGEFFLAGDVRYDGMPRAGLVARFAADGRLLWSRGVSIPYSPRILGLAFSGTKLVALGQASVSNTYRFFSLEMNAATGDTVATKMWKLPYTYPESYWKDFYAQGFTRLDNGNFVLYGKGNTDMTNPYTDELIRHHMTFELSPSLRFVKSLVLQSRVRNSTYNSRITAHADGSLSFSRAYAGDKASFGKVVQGQVISERVIDYSGVSRGWISNFLSFGNRGDVVTHHIITDEGRNSYLEFMRLQPTTVSGSCMGTDTAITSVGREYYHEAVLPVDSLVETLFEVTHPKSYNEQRGFTITSACTATSFCETLKLTPSAGALCLSTPLTVSLARNPECGGRPLWDYDSTAVSSFTYLDDSTVRLRFSRPWEGRIAASIGGCATVGDSFRVRVLEAPAVLELGPDTALCPGNTLLLNARRGYATYRWPDGSADSTFLVSAPGTYPVETSDACGNTYRDTVVVTAAPPVPLDLGPDRVKCNGDTLQLSAPAGFLAYRWSNDYHLSSTTARNVVVNPLVDTSYYLRAEKTPGCFAYDTVRVTVHTSPPLDLGRDTSFCPGGSVWLRVPDAFSDYQWSGTATTREFRVYAKGVYWLRATTPEGCVSTDTLEVLEVYKAPIVQLDDDSTLCTGTVRTLDAGPFASYEWQDGSTDRTFTASVPGDYRVTVTDAHGCTGADSVRITRLLPLPGDFLPADTALCSYGTLVLKPGSAYATYAWSNGAVTPALTIDRPGRYTLQVTDAAGCTGRDEIIVHPKECMKGLYVPNAFTPNKDGRNDLLRAMLFGPVKSYAFTVYNRWGEAVFHTTDPLKGWDGTYRGRPQDTNVFVWTCRYQLEGEEEKREKGTVVVIR